MDVAAAWVPVQVGEIDTLKAGAASDLIKVAAAPFTALSPTEADGLAPAELAGVAHVPSPRQKVEDEAEVPLFRFDTGRLPLTSEARLTVAA